MSKVGLCAYTRILQRKFENDERKDLVVNSCHPGYVDTDMTSHKVSYIVNSSELAIMFNFQGPLSPNEGASCPTFLALLPPKTEIKGEFLDKHKQVVDWINGSIDL